MKSKIYYCKPSITDTEIAYVDEAIRFGWGENCYHFITRFEQDFKQHLGCQFAIATSCCTGALHMGLAALGIGLGDEVILADINWIATVAPICHLGATPIFVDILPDTWCLDPDEVEKAISPRTKAIIATHLYGNLCEVDHLLALSKKYHIPLIEDAAEALGSVYHGKRAGSMGLFGTFSFHGSKTITTGEGGIFVTNDLDLYESVLTLSNHGRNRRETKQFWPEVVGFKYKMSNIQAALGCAQLERIEELVCKKRAILSYYKKHLSLPMNPEKEGEVNGTWMPTVVFEEGFSLSESRLLEAFKLENIDARSFFHPLTSLPMFKDYHKNPLSLNISSRALNLPSYHDMTEEDLDRVIHVIQGALHYA